MNALPGNLVREIVERLDKETQELKSVSIELNGVTIIVNFDYWPGGDGKAIQTALGLLGAKCTSCTCTLEQKNDPKFAKESWYPEDRSRDQNLQLYESLEKNADGSIDTKVSTITRLGMTQQPMGNSLDWTSMYIFQVQSARFKSQLQEVLC